MRGPTIVAEPHDSQGILKDGTGGINVRCHLYVAEPHDSQGILKVMTPNEMAIATKNGVAEPHDSQGILKAFMSRGTTSVAIGRRTPRFAGNTESCSRLNLAPSAAKSCRRTPRFAGNTERRLVAKSGGSMRRRRTPRFAGNTESSYSLSSSGSFKLSPSRRTPRFAGNTESSPRKSRAHPTARVAEPHDSQGILKG